MAPSLRPFGGSSNPARARSGVSLLLSKLVRELEGLRVSEKAWLLTFDVESLYPHVEHEGCLDACTEAAPGDCQQKCMVRAFLELV
jgi:hypothetical protein